MNDQEATPQQTKGIRHLLDIPLYWINPILMSTAVIAFLAGGKFSIGIYITLGATIFVSGISIYYYIWKVPRSKCDRQCKTPISVSVLILLLASALLSGYHFSSPLITFSTPSIENLKLNIKNPVIKGFIYKYKYPCRITLSSQDESSKNKFNKVGEIIDELEFSLRGHMFTIRPENMQLNPNKPVNLRLAVINNHDGIEKVEGEAFLFDVEIINK